MAVSAKIKRLVGKAMPATEYQVEAGTVRRLARAIGEDNPIHIDSDVAKAAGYPALVGTLTLPSAFMDLQPLLAEMDLEPQGVMHAEEEQEYFRPICVGDTLSVAHRLLDAYDKPSAGGRLIFLVFETRAHDSRGRDVFKTRRVLVALKS